MGLNLEGVIMIKDRGVRRSGVDRRTSVSPIHLRKKIQRRPQKRF